MNGDYSVDTGDLLVIARAVAGQFAYKADFDLNKDGFIDTGDLLLVSQQLTKWCTPP